MGDLIYLPAAVLGLPWGAPSFGTAFFQAIKSAGIACLIWLARRLRPSSSREDRHTRHPAVSDCRRVGPG